MGNSAQKPSAVGNSAQKLPEIEDIMDEVELSSTEVGYPVPTSPTPLDDIFERKERWLTDTFNNGSDDTELLKSLNLITMDLNTMSDEYVDDDATVRPPTAITEKRLAFPFATIDNHARMADPKLLDSFEDLIEYLTKPLLHDQYIKIKTARAILVWLSRQNLEEKNYGKKGTDTPRGLIQYLKEEKMSYTTCYAILCRKAGLQCAVIKGYVKGITNAGDDGSQILSSWNAVYGETGWQIVQAYWTCRAIFGYSSGKWTKVEEDGKTMSKKGKASPGTEKNIFDERYFMPDPEQFIYQCAENKEWQLFPPCSIVSSYAKFAKKPILHFSFFDLGLQLISEQNCVLETKDGFCKIELKAKPSNAHLITLSYELYRKKADFELNGEKENGIEGETDDEEDFARMVFNTRAAEVFTFDMRFLRSGIYKLNIRGGPHTSHYQSLCQFKVVCKKGMVGRGLLPIDCGKIGWGPGPTAKEAGLLLPSKPSGLISVSTTDRKTDVKFQLRDMTEKNILQLYMVK
ncbi:lim and transglutaminase domain protein ltd-1-like [Ruditapes philippinarum]|uniref:lim and transglutaminase domain protein ltd-1-like n=1 Tax=Ruditapes philippinarum TaxID=129788 RepID=UPI00295B8F8B|nr:lim and transglutaminase domain protein ltd-1-like [Ruditapes philippinarum]